MFNGLLGPSSCQAAGPGWRFARNCVATGRFPIPTLTTITY